MPTDQYWSEGVEGPQLLEPSTFATEDELQNLIGQFPELLSRSVDDEEEPTSWLPIGREVPVVYLEDDDSTRWRLDNLFIDGEGVPTLVEVKQASDPRTRREVIAQLLDYAANFRDDWSGEKLAAYWRHSLSSAELSADTSMADYLDGSNFEYESELWDRVDANVAANTLRLMIVADKLPGRLVRIIRYLNEQMANTQLLGVAIHPRISSDGGRTFSVSVEGAPDVPKPTKGRRPRREREEFEAILRSRQGEAEADAVLALIGELEEGDDRFVSIGSSVGDPKLYLNFRIPGLERSCWPISISPKHGRVYLEFKSLRSRPGFTEEAQRQLALDGMRRASGDEMLIGTLRGSPYFASSCLIDPARRSAVAKEVLSIVEQITSAVGSVR